MEEKEIILNPSYITIGECIEGTHMATLQIVNNKVCVVLHDNTEDGLLDRDSFVSAIPIEDILHFRNINKDTFYEICHSRKNINNTIEENS